MRQLPFCRVWDEGRGLATVDLFVVVVVVVLRDAVVAEALATVVAFVGGFVDACGTRGCTLVADVGLPSGAVESVVVVWSDEVVSEVFGTVDGRVNRTDGFIVDRVGTVAGFGFTDAAVGAFAAPSR